MKKLLLAAVLTLATAVSGTVTAQSTGYFTYSATKTSSTIVGDYFTGRSQQCRWKMYRTFHSSTGSTSTSFYGYTTTYGETVTFGSPPPCPYPDMP